MKRILSMILIVMVALGFAGCSQSVMDKVKISNVEKESYRPEGYVLTGDLSKDGFAWDGVLITGDITNNSNQTLTVAVIVNSYVGKDKKYNRYGESNIIHIDPGETKRFEYNFNYDEQGITAAWTHDISDIVKK